VREALQEHGPLSRGAFAIAVLVSLAVLFAPADGVPVAPAGVDKVVHVVLFAVLALTGRWAGIGRSVLATVLVGYAAISEVLQGVTALERSASVADWAADVAGIVAGLVLWPVFASRRNRAV
jgi:membrane associated rhomboid family serine protease